MEKTLRKASGDPVVALVRSSGHYEGVIDALRLIEEEIAQELKGKKRILIKPNFVSTRHQQASIHVEAVRALLDFLSMRSSGRFIIGEGPAGGSLKDALRNFGHLELQRDYDIDFVDLNDDDYVEIEGFDSSLRPLEFRVSKLAAECDYKISVAKPKTHDNVIVTLSVKNMVVGSLVGCEKSKIHQGTKAINLNIAKIYKILTPNLGVIDGFEGMEGRGPISGASVDFRIAAASRYPVALDAVVTKAMGFDPSKVGYLYHLDSWGVDTINLNRIKVVGISPEEASVRFEPHPSFSEQLRWR